MLPIRRFHGVGPKTAEKMQALGIETGADLRAALVARGWRIGGLYRPMANPFFNEHYAANMHALSDPVFEQGRRGTMGLLKHIRGGGMGVLLFDVYSSDGTPIDFLGQPAPTLTSSAEIAVKTGALFVPFFGIRKADGLSFEAVFEAPIPHGEPVEMMREATRRLEARIALGATRLNALRPAMQEAMHRGFMAMINAMAGVVSLPGMMTGQLLAGVAPAEAVRYQILSCS
mgnify:CR=1 FL=1